MRTEEELIEIQSGNSLQNEILSLPRYFTGSTDRNIYISDMNKSEAIYIGFILTIDRHWT